MAGAESPWKDPIRVAAPLLRCATVRIERLTAVTASPIGVFRGQPPLQWHAESCPRIESSLGGITMEVSVVVVTPAIVAWQPVRAASSR